MRTEPPVSLPIADGARAAVTATPDPLLDPHLPSRHPALARLWIDSYRRMLRDPATFERVVRGYVLPAGSRTSDAVDLGRYFHDADAYVNDILRLLPESLARHLAPLPETRGSSTIRDLLRTLEVAPPVVDGRVRVVEIEGFDAQACGGTHVSAIGELGRLSIFRTENKGRINKRLYVRLEQLGE